MRSRSPSHTQNLYIKMAYNQNEIHKTLDNGKENSTHDLNAL